jgi:hypothetical protein
MMDETDRKGDHYGNQEKDHHLEENHPEKEDHEEEMIETARARLLRRSRAIHSGCPTFRARRPPARL